MCTLYVSYLRVKMENYPFSSKFTLLLNQLSGSYFCSVTGYDKLASFTTLVNTQSICTVLVRKAIFIEEKFMHRQFNMKKLTVPDNLLIWGCTSICRNKINGISKN